MFIRQYSCVENGKRHAYWGLVESYRTARGPRQRVVAWPAVCHDILEFSARVLATQGVEDRGTLTMGQ